MISPLLSGIGFALILTIIPGPVFFGLIQTSIQKGVKFGGMFALGVASSDLLCIVFTYYGISSLLENPLFQNIVAVAGGVMMCVVGLFYFFKPQEKKVPLNPMQKETKKGNFILKGFFLNIFNPGVIFYWVALVSVISVRYENNQIKILLFFGSLILTILFVDVLKSYIANRIKVYFTNTILTKLNKALGFILFGVGVKLLIDAYTGVSFI